MIYRLCISLCTSEFKILEEILTVTALNDQLLHHFFCGLLPVAPFTHSYLAAMPQ